ncbi:MAG: hypothetical protein HY978_01135 [Candidatus Liptonbacteria bacterium]|nr:hypothetical protein [Candidatus Liptonbacteria bacterium]
MKEKILAALMRPIQEVGLPIKAVNALRGRRPPVIFLGDLALISERELYRSTVRLGPVFMGRIKAILSEHSLALGMDLDSDLVDQFQVDSRLETARLLRERIAELIREAEAREGGPGPTY